MVYTDRAGPKQLPVSVSGRERSPGGLNPQRLSGLTDNLCTCLPGWVAR